MFEDLDENINIMYKQIRTFKRELGPIKMEILGLNNTIFKIKNSLHGPNRLDTAEERNNEFEFKARETT